METDLKCNRLTCRVALTDKAIVTNCSHIFCIDCANELFGTPQVCPACESTLPEPDDVVASTTLFLTTLYRLRSRYALSTQQTIIKPRYYLA
ncbi:hypothetical protein RSAG8_03647, partial [Rhizoctonia solani AG-8 WAC10335]